MQARSRNETNDSLIQLGNYDDDSQHIFTSALSIACAVASVVDAVVNNCGRGGLKI